MNISHTGTFIFNIELAASISGIVIDADTFLPLNNIEVNLYDSEGDLVASQFTNSNGDYTISGLNAGTYYAETD
ncbi:MAG: carboxypeptidase-like regulatory domain-containing protein, partial [Bacteroidales bacterium]